MTKTMAMVMTLTMVLTAATALAKGSKGNDDINTGDTDLNEIDLIHIGPTEKLQEIMDKITEANQNEGDPLKGLPGEVVGLIPGGFGTINDMSCWQLVGDVTGTSELLLIFKFETPYEEGEEVTVLIGIAPADGEVEWIVKTGTGDADGNVVVKVTAEELAKISNNTFIEIPVSK